MSRPLTAKTTLSLKGDESVGGRRRGPTAGGAWALPESQWRNEGERRLGALGGIGCGAAVAGVKSASMFRADGDGGTASDGGAEKGVIRTLYVDEVLGCFRSRSVRSWRLAEEALPPGAADRPGAGPPSMAKGRKPVCQV